MSDQEFEVPDDSWSLVVENLAAMPIPSTANKADGGMPGWGTCGGDAATTIIIKF